jgi:hypothetical protein
VLVCSSGPHGHGKTKCQPSTMSSERPCTAEEAELLRHQCGRRKAFTHPKCRTPYDKQTLRTGCSVKYFQLICQPIIVRPSGRPEAQSGRRPRATSGQSFCTLMSVRTLRMRSRIVTCQALSEFSVIVPTSLILRPDCVTSPVNTKCALSLRCVRGRSMLNDLSGLRCIVLALEARPKM